MAFIAQPGGETADLQHDAHLRKYKDIGDPQIDMPHEFEVTEYQARDMAGRHKQAAGYDIISQRLPLPVHIDHETGGEQEYHEQDERVDLRLQFAVETDEDETQIEYHIGQQKIF